MKPVKAGEPQFPGCTQNDRATTSTIAGFLCKYAPRLHLNFQGCSSAAEGSIPLTLNTICRVTTRDDSSNLGIAQETPSTEVRRRTRRETTAGPSAALPLPRKRPCARLQSHRRDSTGCSPVHFQAGRDSYRAQLDRLPSEPPTPPHRGRGLFRRNVQNRVIPPHGLARPGKGRSSGSGRGRCAGSLCPAGFDPSRPP